MTRVVVIGGGVSGCAAAITATKAGAEVVLLERTDLLLGAALAGGTVNQGGRFCLAEEAKAMGAGEMMEELERIALPRASAVRRMQAAGVTKHVYTFDCGRVEPTIRTLVAKMGVQIRFVSRAIDVAKEDRHIVAVKLANGEWVEGDAFVDCTGTAGGMANCIRYGKGCVMCPMFRCPTFGNRVSIAAAAGASELNRRRPDGTPGLMVFSTHFYKDSLSPELQKTLQEHRDARIGTKGMVDPSEYSALTYSLWAKRGIDPETGHAVDEQTVVMEETDVVLSDRGNPGIVSSPTFPYIPYEKLREIPGLENAIVVFPQGGRSNIVWGLSLTERENSLMATGFQNLLVAGEKTAVVGICECVTTGLLAGHNAVRAALGQDLLTLPRTIVAGDFIAFVAEDLQQERNLTTFFSTQSGLYLSRLIKLGLCKTDADEIRANVEAAGLMGIYAKKLTSV